MHFKLLPMEQVEQKDVVMEDNPGAVNEPSKDQDKNDEHDEVTKPRRVENKLRYEDAAPLPPGEAHTTAAADVVPRKDRPPLTIGNYIDH